MIADQAMLPDLTPKRQARRVLARVMGNYGALIALAILIVAFSVASPQYFLTVNNLLQILNQSALSTIVACGLTIVLVSGEFDLSVGYQASLGAIGCAELITLGVPIPLAILVACAAGVVVGLLNGYLVARLEVNALVATLGTGSAITGVVYLTSGGGPIVVPGHSLSFLQIAIGTWIGVPKLVYYMVIVVAFLWVVLNRTDLGRNMRALGGNAEAAKLAGIRTGRVTFGAFICAGVCASLTGVLLASSLGSGQPTGGDGYMLSSFAAAFLGSTVLREGQFHILGTVVGVITVNLGFNGLAIIGVPSYFQYLFQGILLIAAVAFSSVGRKFLRR